MKLIDLDLLKGKVEAMQACEPHYANNFLNDALNPSTEWGCIEDMIESIPVIDAQPVKHGRWIKCDSQPNQKMCSSCCGVGVAKGIAQFFTYCPFCGAYMRGDKDGR